MPESIISGLFGISQAFSAIKMTSGELSPHHMVTPGPTGTFPIMDPHPRGSRPSIPSGPAPPAWCLPTTGLLLGSNMRIFGPDLLQSYCTHLCACPPALFRAKNGQIRPITAMCWQNDQEHILVQRVPTVRLRGAAGFWGLQVRKI